MDKEIRTRPNILVFLTDQQHFFTMGCNGNTQIRTPNLDRLAAEGINFRNAFTATPVCGPARASIFTGLYPPTHGVVVNDRPLPPDMPTVATELKKTGYLTAYYGRMHYPILGPQLGFEDAYVITDGVLSEPTGAYREYYDNRPEIRGQWNNKLFDETGRITCGTEVIPEEHHWETFTANETIRFLEGYQKNHVRDPFLMFCGFQFPHEPHFVPEPYDKMYSVDEIEIPEIDPEQLAKKPHRWQKWYQKNFHGRSKEEMKKLLSIYWGQVTMMDHQVGRILDSLREQGLLDNTLILFTSDHGDYAGQQYSFTKDGHLYDCLVHIPLLMRLPESRRSGRIVNELVSHIDLMPTILDYADVQFDGVQHGRSFRPLLEQENPIWRDAVFASHASGADRHSSSRMVRTHGHKLCINYKDRSELYDLKNDPNELNNRIDDPNYASVLSDLKDRLLEWSLELQRYPMPQVPDIDPVQANQQYATWYQEHPEAVVRPPFIR